MRTISSRFALALAGVLAIAAVPAAGNAAGLHAPSIKVDHRDLDLTSEQGQATLQRRIAHAAEVACAPAEKRRLSERSEYLACREAAAVAGTQKFEAVVAAATANKQVAANTEK